MEVLLLNTVGRAKGSTLRGRQYLVAPATLLVPGVLQGSHGSLYYPPEEVTGNKSFPPSVWNHMPIVVYHPTRNGVPLSAADPMVLDGQGIGMVLGARAGAGGALKAELWFDVEDTRRVDQRVLDMLENGDQIELSTGLHVDKDPAPAGAIDSKGRPYDVIARNYRPDHLAILPDQVGACSLQDGCGVFNTHTLHSPPQVRDMRDVRDVRDMRDVRDVGDSTKATQQPRGDVGLWVPFQEVNLNARSDWTPPPAGSGAPKEVKDILRAAYASWRDRHQSEESEVKARGARMAWGAVRRAGWSKGRDGKWRKSKAASKSKSGSGSSGVKNLSKSYGGKKLPASAFAYTPDPQEPSTWKLRIDDARHVAGAAAALSGGGFRGQKVKIPKSDLPRVKARIRAAWKKFFPDKDSSEMPQSIRNARECGCGPGGSGDLLEADSGDGRHPPAPLGWQPVQNAVVPDGVSLDDIQERVRCAFRDAHPSKYDPTNGRLVEGYYVISVFPDYVIYIKEDKDVNGPYGPNPLYRQSYSIDQSGNITMEGGSQAVERVIQYVPIED